MEKKNYGRNDQDGRTSQQQDSERNDFRNERNELQILNSDKDLKETYRTPEERQFRDHGKDSRLEEIEYRNHSSATDDSNFISDTTSVINRNKNSDVDSRRNEESE